MLTLRTYHPLDYPQVKSNLEEADMFDEIWDSEENLQGMVENNSEAILVAEDNGEVIGNIFFVPYGSKVGYLFRLAVKKECRQKGIATQLIEKAIESAKKKGFVEVALFADSNKENLLNFYQKRNFQKSKDSFYCLWKSI
jgi:ribosomal protein S18 acetylase RimI-like enzyme